jgi:hypothetical protein
MRRVGRGLFPMCSAASEKFSIVLFPVTPVRPIWRFSSHALGSNLMQPAGLEGKRDHLIEESPVHRAVRFPADPQDPSLGL